MVEDTLTREGGVVVLVLLAHAGEVANNLNPELGEHFSIANARALEDLGRPERPGADNNHLARLHNRLRDFGVVCAVTRGYICNTDSGVVSVEDDAGNARVTPQEEVALHVHDAVDVG